MFRAPISQRISTPLQPLYLHARGISRTSGTFSIRRTFMMSTPLQEGAPPKHRTRKRLIILCDGTGRTSLDADGKANPTNITRMSRAIAHYGTAKDEFSTDGPETVEQVVFYQPGVGTETGQKVRGGAYGLGVSANIRAAYAFLAHNYAYRDLIYCIGFSRGAYTARGIAGLITALGLLTKRGMDRFPEVYDNYYRPGQPENGSQNIEDYLRQDLLDNKELDETARDAVQVVGVFDTVAFVADGWMSKVSNLFGGDDERPEFNNVRLSPSVKYGYHALALDEERKAFEPTLWQLPKDSDLADKKTQKPRNVEMQQVWFSGVHSDIGGGLEKSYLSDITLAWMISRCSGPDKLAFSDLQKNDDWYLMPAQTAGALNAPVSPDTLWDTSKGANTQHESLGSRAVTAVEDLKGVGPRVPPKTLDNTNEEIHRSIRDRNMLGSGAGTHWACKLLTGEKNGDGYGIAKSQKTLSVNHDEAKDLDEDRFHGMIRHLPLKEYDDTSKTKIW